MTRSDLINRLAELNPQYPAKDVALAVNVILDAFFTTLSNGDRIEIRGFGSFALNYIPPKLGRNPRTGEPVNVPGNYRPHFKSGKELRWRVDK